MTATVLSPAAAARPPRMPLGHRVVQVLGELMITLGVVLMLLVVYQLWWTNVASDRQAGQIEHDLQKAWNTAPTQAAAGVKIPGDAIGIMYIERLGKRWEKPIVQGVDLDHLALGVGHFLHSAGPGQVGNFAVAAHRATHGEPFAYLDQIRPGDKIVVETKTDWFVYSVDPMPGANGKAWKLVDPNYGAVILPVPEEAGVTATKRQITLVTCNPRWGHSTRLIVYGHLIQDERKPGPLPAALAYTGQKG